MSAATPTIFCLNNQTIGYKKHSVLLNVHLTIKRGEMVAIVGASGSGKSSLLSALYQSNREQVAFCPQQSMLVDTLSVYHNIYMGKLHCHPFWYNLLNLIRPFARHQQAISGLGQLLGLSGLLFKSIDQLSGGQQQRTAIGRALYQSQPTFVGDEPLSSLDPVQGSKVLQLIKSRHQTVVIALHNKEMALSQFDRIIAIHDGAIAFDCAAASLSNQQIDAIYDQDFATAVPQDHSQL